MIVKKVFSIKDIIITALISNLRINALLESNNNFILKIAHNLLEQKKVKIVDTKNEKFFKNFVYNLAIIKSKFYL